MAEKEQPEFEEALLRLEDIVKKLEDNSISLEESIKLYEEGIELSKRCTQALEEAELRIENVNKQHSEEHQ